MLSSCNRRILLVLLVLLPAAPVIDSYAVNPPNKNNNNKNNNKKPSKKILKRQKLEQQQQQSQKEYLSDLQKPNLATPSAVQRESWTPVPCFRSVAIVGGTHGNEYTGVWIVREWEEQHEKLASNYPSIDITTVIGNPIAHLANKRFMDQDLNRQFSASQLDNDAFIPTTVEGRRARELNELLGPKIQRSENDKDNMDLVIDLHSTTSNMGITLIVPEGDVIMTQAAAYVRTQCLRQYDDVYIMMHPTPDKNTRSNVGSMAKHGFTIEVGPVPQGLLRHDAVLKTKCALFALLDFVEQYNTDSDTLLKTLHDNSYPTGRVPCYRTARAKTLSNLGKLSWPSHPENPNFPTYMVHEALQDQDFKPIQIGDPMFVTLDGETLYYDGSHGEYVCLTFINEGGYYFASSGTGIGVAIETAYDLLDGTFIPCAEMGDDSVCKFEEMF